MPEPVAELGFPALAFLPISGCPAGIPVHCIYGAEDDAPVLRAFLDILHETVTK